MEFPATPVHIRAKPRRRAKNLPPGAEQRIASLCKRMYRVPNTSGHGSMDLRMRDDCRVYRKDFAESAESVGISYEALLQRILNLGLRYQAPWMH